jgi:hypothetical protein
MSTDREVREFPVRSCYFTPLEVQNIIDLMDGYLRLAFSTMDHDTAIKNIDEMIWDTMKRAYQSLTEEV